MTAPVVVGPQQPIDPPRIQAPATGLVSLARQPDKGDDRWMLGYQYRPEVPVGSARNRGTTSTTIGATIGGTAAIADRVHTIPFYLTVEDAEAAFSYEAVDLSDRVQRELEAYTSKLLAHEFWTGEIATADNLPNRVLAGPDTVDITGDYGGAGPLAPQAAVAALMQALADHGMADGMIHCSKYVGIRLPDAWRNEQTLTDHGFLVVADSGYPGTGPAGTGGPNWAYATEIVNVRLGPIELVPMDLPQSIDRASNTVTYRAQRVGAVDFAGPVFAIQVTP
jgi:hypothetical protein